MSTFYKWASYDDAEVLGDDPWDVCLKNGIFHWPSSYHDAASTLFANRWAGKRVVFCSENGFSFGDTPKKLNMEGLWGYRDDLPYDYGDEFGKDVSGLFAVNKGKTRTVFWENGEDVLYEKPYEGPFDLEVVRYRYIVNEDTMEYIDRDRCPVLYVNEDGAVEREEIFASLLGTFEIDQDYQTDPEGRWLGCRIHATNEQPGGQFADRSLDFWAMGDRTALTNEQIKTHHDLWIAKGNSIDEWNLAHAEKHFGLTPMD